MKKNIQFKTTYHHPIGKVWKAITTKEGLSTWLMPTSNFESVVGHTFQFNTTPRGSFDGVIHCKVLEVKAPNKVVISWTNGDLDTIVTFLLRKDGNKTHLDFEHAGFEGLMNRLIVRNLLAKGWKKTILTVLLPQYLQK